MLFIVQALQLPENKLDSLCAIIILLQTVFTLLISALTMLARRIISIFNCTFAGVAAITFQEQFYAFSTAQTANRTCISKNVDKGIAHIKSTFNNTIVTITDMNGNALSWASPASATIFSAVALPIP